MAIVLGSLLVSLGLENGAFKSGLTEAQKELRRTQKQFEGIGLSMRQFGANIGLAVMGAFAGAVGAMALLTRESINTADELSKAAQSTGIAVEELSRLRYAADLSGISFDSLQTAVGRLSRNMFEASQGIGSAGRAFDTLGVSVRNGDGTLRSATDVMGDVAARFAAMEDGAAKTALSIQIFGRAGADMIPLLNGGRDGLRELTAEADKFGIVIDAETGRKAEAFNDNLTRLRGAFSAVAARIAAELLPHLVDFTDWLIANRADIDAGIAKFGQFINGAVRLGQHVAAAANWMEERFGAVSRAISFMINPLSRVISLVSVFGSAPRQNPFGGMVDSMIGMGREALESANALKRFGFTAVETGGAVSRGIGGGAREASRALRQVAADGEAMARQVQGLLDRLFPEIASARKLTEDLALLDGANIDSALRARARLARLAEGQPKPVVSEGLIGTGPLAEVGKVKEAVEAIRREMVGLQEGTKVQTVRIAETFQSMVDNVLGSLRSLVDGFRGGDFLSILEGAVGIFTTLGGAGLFGSGIQNGLNSIPAFANGTNFAPGGLSIVGERGPELLNIPRGAGVMSNRELRGLGGSTVTVVPSPYFDVVVDGRIGQAAPVIADLGSAQAQQRAAQAARRRYR
jgi:hypothetical protein